VSRPLQFRLLLLLCAAAALPLAAQDRVLRPSQPAAQATPPEQRIALVIGNGQYKDVPLLNPVNDAQAVAKALSRTMPVGGVCVTAERERLPLLKREAERRDCRLHTHKN